MGWGIAGMAPGWDRECPASGAAPGPRRASQPGPGGANPEAALFRRGWPAFGKPCRYSLRPNAEQAGNTRKCRRGKKSPEFGPRNDAQNDAEAPPPDSRASPGDRIATSRRESGYGGDPMEPPPEPSIQRSRSTSRIARSGTPRQMILCVRTSSSALPEERDEGPENAHSTERACTRGSVASC